MGTIKIPNNKKVEFFCGTGGVGKTTTAAARALFLAQKGKKVLLITIDPAKRLKQVLGIENQEEGCIHKVAATFFTPTLADDTTFDALLMTPYSTLKRIGIENGQEDKIDTNILKTLTKPYGGMNEIMAIVELQMQLKKNLYDIIILDTPPGKHFIDFLESSKKIQNFFDKTFVDIFQFLGKNFNKNSKFLGPKSLITNLVSSGIKKLLGYLEDVTGENFVKEFIDSISILYLNRQTFLDALHFHQELKKTEFSNWFLVTSADQHKIDEAVEFKREAANFIHNDHFLIINKCLTNDFVTWLPLHENLAALKTSLLLREKQLKDFSSKNFENILEFHEVLSASPQEHVRTLSREFEQF